MKITVGIYLKAIFTVIVIILTVACVLSIFFIHHEKQVIHKSIQERGMALAENFAHNVEYGVLTANSQIISEALYHIMIQPDIVYCRVQDVRGIDLNTEWAEDVYFTIPDDILSASQKTEELLVQVFQLGDKGHYYEISAPVLSEGMKIYQNEEGLFYASETDEASTQATIMKRKIGTVHVGFSMERADSLLLVAQQKIILITGIIIFLAVIATIFLARIAIMPILKIVEGTRRLAAGNLDVKVPVIARDEVGQLADSFNMMTASLKSSREELMSAKKYVEAAIANIIDALFVLDLDGQLRTVNLAACILLEYSEDELLGKPFSELLTSEEKHTASVLLQEINKNGFVRGIELTFVSKMGKYVPVSFSGAKMVFTRKQGEEEVMGIVGIARDMREMNRLIANLQQAKEKLEDWSRMLEQKVDERTQALERSQKATLNMLKDLDETKTYIENIIANFLDTLIVYNPEGIIQKANAATKGLLGYTEDELLGKSIGMICNEDIALHKVLTQGVLSNYEMGYKAKDGKIVPMLFSGSLMCNKSGTPIGIVGMAKDITLRIQAEQSLQEYTQQIEEANKELDDFTYIISHDLKEPLRSINAFSNFILEDYSDRLDEEGQRYLTRIQANSYRMQELIEDLLELSRIDRQKNPVEEVDTEQLISEVKIRLEYAIKQKNTDIIIRGRLPKIFCDRIRLTEVFVNLVSNAVKFMDKDNPAIEIGCSKKEKFNEFYVKDNGPGIDERYFNKIFVVFQRLGKREDVEGTGAGLSIVKKIVEMHGGEVRVESKVGEGATFYFTIPINKDFAKTKKRIGEILVGKKLVKREDVTEALREQRKKESPEKET